MLYSEKCDRYYIGYCSDVLKRLERHNAGMVTATRNCRPYLIKAVKNFATELEARKEELRLKKQKSPRRIGSPEIETKTNYFDIHYTAFFCSCVLSLSLFKCTRNTNVAISITTAAR
ncbi:GIY-YIG nuclease family protein [Terrimonas pollutisoli]|uniref:GIY-YIG nuclease family protein n=1 Tax=Terrimonas pollutisoli TaxID=3034147 RepID=UPI0034E01A20